MTEPQADSALSETSTVRKFDELDPNDGVVLDYRIKGLYVQTDGVVSLEDWSSPANVVQFQVAAGQILPVRPRRILTTGTTAVVVGLWT